ncbi:hypothetical protein SUGI_0863990 [Cryptomeria japonica]|nr:hypothetical protein SUGI_0863990 [Cryptomeria japonica]
MRVREQAAIAGVRVVVRGVGMVQVLVVGVVKAVAAGMVRGLGLVVGMEAVQEVVRATVLGLDLALAMVEEATKFMPQFARIRRK